MERRVGIPPDLVFPVRDMFELATELVNLVPLGVELSDKSADFLDAAQLLRLLGLALCFDAVRNIGV
jgi:hypothetical protein